LATRFQRPSLDSAAAFCDATPLDEHNDGTRSPVGHAAIQPGPPFGPHSALHLMSHLPGADWAAVVIHATEFAAHLMFVPAESTGYISRA
jgi:hypothetical protein